MSTLDKRNPIAKAVKYALLAGTAMTAYTAPTAFAAEDEAEDEQKITITGSRIKRTDVEGPTPVTVISREQIELSGHQTVADVIRTTTFNSFGSFRERSGSSGGQAATVNLRGLGSSRTAVLVNGRRLPGSPLFGTSAANLNALPLAAVERIDILTDGASAIYGADAIAGVVNIILRDDYEGAEFKLGAAVPDQEGGTEESGSFAIGHSSDKGNIVFTAEIFRRDAIFDKDRPYSQVQVLQEGGSFGSDTIGISVGGNTGFALDFSEAFVVGDCQTVDNGGLYAGVFTDPFGVAGEGCGFGYADISKLTGGIDRGNTFLSANYEIDSNNTLYIQNSLSRTDSSGRYAPAVGFFQVDGGVDANANGEFSDNGEDFLLFHRFVGHGPRDENFTAFEVDTVIGLEGFIGEVEYDVYFRTYDTDIKNIGRGYVSLSAIEAAVANNSYDFVNPAAASNADAVTATSVTLSRDLATSYKEFGLTFSGFGADLFDAGEIGWSVGLDYAEETYRDGYDAAREAGDVIGSAGNSSAGERDRNALFGELLVPLLDDLELQVAARFDDYSDFGSETSPQIALKYTPLDNLLLRASFGEGFKAPDLTNLHSARAESFNNVTDVVQCSSLDVDENGTVGDAADVAACPTFQVQNFSGGNPDLFAETAQTSNFGVVYEPIDNLSFSLDIYSTELENAITQISIQQLVNLELAGAALPAGTAINRGASTTGSQGQTVPGRITTIETGFANVSELEVNGWDFKVNYLLDTDIGRFAFAFTHSQIDEYLFTSLPGEDPVEQIDTRAAPEYRQSLQINWNSGDHTVALDSYFIADTLGGAGDPTAPRVPAFDNHNLTYIYNASWDADITIGIRNITDNDPSIDPVEGYTGNFERQLYDVFGRTPFITYTQRF